MEIRTPVLTLKGSRPRPLDDGGAAAGPANQTCGRILSSVRRRVKRPTKLKAPMCLPTVSGSRLRRRPSRGAATSMRASRLWTGRFAGVRIQERTKPRKGLLVVIPAAAHITDPSGEVRNQDEFLAQPCKVGDETQAHDARLTVVAGKRTGGFFGSLRLRHLNL